MRKTILAAIAAMIALPVQAQYQNPFGQPQRNLLDEQRQAIANGRYGMTYERQQQLIPQGQLGPQGGIKPRAGQVYQPLQPGILPSPVIVLPRY